MKVVRSEAHREHSPTGELYGGELVLPFERPERWDQIVAELGRDPDTEWLDPEPVPDSILEAVHDSAYLRFLRTAWTEWVAAGYSGDMIPTCFPVRRLRQQEPDDIDGKLGYFAFAAETSITAGTWAAALDSASIAFTAQRAVAAGEPISFALCRPPGHHAARDYFGGYCFLNNAAVAAEAFLRDGIARVAVLDVDFHHGNGTQDIFYERADVLFASLHGDPRHEFPHFSGFPDETGAGPGAGATINYPLPPGTDAATWLATLDDAVRQISDFGAEALVVSLGVDTFRGDPISSFTLESGDFTSVGRRIATIGVPTVYCMEGGYAVAEIGVNTGNVLRGHLDVIS